MVRPTYRFVFLGAIVLSGCEGGKTKPSVVTPAVQEELSSPPRAKSEVTADKKAPENGHLISTQIDGVWVFFWPELPEGAVVVNEQSRLAGKARISEGCLYVDDQVVVWQEGRRGDIEAAIRDVREGKEIMLEGAGASFPPDPSTNDPEAEAGTEAQSTARADVVSKCRSATNIFGTGRGS